MGLILFQTQTDLFNAPMTDSIQVLAGRAIVSFLIAALMLAAVLYLDIVPHSSDASEDVVTTIQMVVLFFGWVIFSPVVETVVLAVLFKILSNFISCKASAALSATILAALHGLIWWAWPFIVLIPFLIFTMPFRKERTPIKMAILSSALTHSFHNLYGFLCLLAFRIAT